VVPVNDVGEGIPSDIVLLTPAALPSASLSIVVLEYGASYLVLQWSIPLDTGAKD
jgi:hypothetical protein